MKLSKRILKKSDSQLVQRINEIYYDLENIYYDGRHGDMFRFEEAFWRNAAGKYLVKKEPIVCLDYGTGTGFVPMIIGQYLKKEDSLICCDLSTEVLRICENNIKEKCLACKCSFHKIDGTRIPVDDNSIDVITANSVLHHIFDLTRFSEECERTLKPRGMLLVAHEPNKNPKLPFPGNILSLFAKLVCRPKAVCFMAAERVPFLERFMRRILSKVSKSYRYRNKMLSDIAQQLKKENLLDFDLRGTEIQQVVDFHTQHGFDTQELLGKVFQKFKPVEFETYNHLGFFTNNKLAGVIEQYLRKNWPDTGKEIRFVFCLKQM